jgi:predicted Kef-type K+ transport protein
VVAVFVSVALVFGLAARFVGLPPLVGFLAAGFVLNALGYQAGEDLDQIANLGVYLLLFGIGLKLDLRGLLRPQIWGTASLHMLITVAFFSVGLWVLGAAGLEAFAGLRLGPALLVAFALSFSSTVFAVKVLEEKGEMQALHGRVAIGILIVQDIFAVVFMTISTGKLPSPWALALLALPLARPLLLWLMTRCGHAELLVLMGLLLSLGSARIFELVGLKPDLGPLVVGVLVAGHPKASEFAKSLLGFKDLFLTGFFLSIGLSGAPGLPQLFAAALFVVVTPLKVALFFWLLARLDLRARTSLLTSLSLANYSEFGLIVAAVGASSGWIGSDWLVIIAIALSITFVLASPLNGAAHSIYSRFGGRLRPFESGRRIPDEEPIDLGEATVVVGGMGRVGTGAYRFMRERLGETVVGLDRDLAAVREHAEAGHNVRLGDVTDPDFWERVQPGRVRLVLLAMPNHEANLLAATRLAEDAAYDGQVAAIAQFDDELAELRDAGADAAFNFYAEAGTGFAEHVWERMEARSA